MIKKTVFMSSYSRFLIIFLNTIRILCKILMKNWGGGGGGYILKQRVGKGGQIKL